MFGDYRLTLLRFTVLLLALLLSAAGTYWLINERSTAMQHIRQLEMSLATAVSPIEFAGLGDVLGEAEVQAAEQRDTIEILNLYNRRLRRLAAELEASPQLSHAVTADKSEEAPGELPFHPMPTQATPPKFTEAVSGAANWFVTFGSYHQRAMAESRAARIKPIAGQVQVIVDPQGGKTVYRVRVEGIASQDIAASVARQLESEYDLPKLWIGNQ